MAKAGDEAQKAGNGRPKGLLNRFLTAIEVVGNKLPDPAILFLLLLFLTWIASALLAPVQFADIHPVTGEPVRIQNQLTGEALATFMARLVTTFTGFAPLGVVLVALLGVGVAEKTGFINTGLRLILGFTPRSLLTPMLILAAIVSHTAADAGYVLVIPLGGVIFYAAGRHPLAGIGAAFAGVSGGFSANFIPSGIDPLLQGFTQSAAQILDPEVLVNPLCNLMFTGLSSILVIAVGWYLTDRVIEPRLRGTEVDGDPEEMPKMEEPSLKDRRGFLAGMASLVVGLVVLLIWAWPEASPLRSDAGELTAFSAPLMQMLVPLIFVFFLIPGVVHGYVAGTVKTHRDIVDGMSDAMRTMAYYLVMAFFAAQFIAAFSSSNVGLLIALKGANFLRDLGLPAQATVVGIILLSAVVNLFVGSASAKWAVLSVIFVPMLMSLGISPELTQAAYRVGDSVTNIVTPLMPYFPLVVVFCQRYTKNAGIGTVLSLMIPYAVTLLITWTVFLVGYWLLGIPLGLQAGYTYPAV
ncbi:MAG: AbgT family transporter [Acidobacteriota bacterium]|nr:AbgT family transporter [Acidobacteriota bacterium]MDE2923077.1 AbgT family transporter [Acidobacteriota bacterium]MDE3266329.1 AbgT family transporter [Acidobacteriota bacterium]